MTKRGTVSRGGEKTRGGVASLAGLLGGRESGWPLAASRAPAITTVSVLAEWALVLTQPIEASVCIVARLAIG
jgi:hypothetical protein